MPAASTPWPRLNRDPPGTEGAVITTNSATKPLLEVDDLRVGYLTDAGTIVAVHGLSFVLRRGVIMGVAGESGSGKSTVAHAVARLIHPPGVILGGSVRYNGTRQHGNTSQTVDILTMKAEELRLLRWEELAIVFQSAMNALNPVLRVRAQLIDAIQAHRPGESVADAGQRSRQLLELVGVPGDRATAYPHELSGGMRQRVIIAMALALEPDLVIFDEPTTGLDVVVQRAILERLLILRQQLGFSVIFITHDLSLLLEVCDSVMVMYGGRAVEMGSAEQLYSSPLHPYSQGLRDAFPPLAGPKRRLRGIPGLPPDPSNPIHGCAFHPRCPHAFGRCQAELPSLLVIGDRRVRCHLYGDDGPPSEHAPTTASHSTELTAPLRAEQDPSSISAEAVHHR